MRSQELLTKILEIEAIVDEISNNLIPEEYEIAKLDLMRSAIQRLRDVMSYKNASIAQKSTSISNKMSCEELTPEQFAEFYKNYDWIDDREKERLSSKLSSLVNFEYPTLDLFPGAGKFTQFALAAEPLYIADYNIELLEQVGRLFNDYYNNRRLLKFKISDFDLSALPQGQFGSVFSLNYFIVKDVAFIGRWAEQVFNVLRPGGYFLFNFIPDDTVDGLTLTEAYPLSAINYNQLIERMKSTGYEIENVEIAGGITSTILAKKPGELKPMKMSSTLARIIDKSEPLV